MYRRKKSICPGYKLRHLLNLSEVFYRSDIKFSYSAYQRIKIGKHIHHKMQGHFGERMLKVWVLDDKSGTTPACFLVNGYEPEVNTVYQLHRYFGIDIHLQKTVQKDKSQDTKTHVRSIGLQQIMGGIQSIILCQSGDVRMQY